ncbi:MAG: hypothetical protein ACT4OZ_04490 [Gemmatimonadota bacterium]
MIAPATQVRIKLLLAITGLVLFFAGIRTGNETMRRIAIVLVVLAFLVRFLARSPDAPPAETPQEKRESD